MITDPVVQTIMFTGSVGVGKRIMELASRNLTNVVLELGGKDPMLVCKDADLERAARGAVWLAFMNSGQSCASVERLYVAEEIEKEFTARVVELTRSIKVGNPLEPGVDMGPMTTLGQLRLVEEHIADAKTKGAAILCGGEKPDGLPGYFITPAVLNNVDHSMRIMTEETFGPTLPIMPFYALDDAVALANDSVYGLTASVWTRNRKTAAWLAERIEAGTVTINDHMFSFTEPKAIWGGIKQTGMGRSHGLYGLHHLVNIKYVSSDYARKKGLLWWFPYGDPKPGVIRNALGLLHQDGVGAKLKAARALLPSLGMVRAGVSFKSMLEIAGRFFRR
jgi:succinate-semialdehyde dehydrogenase/glutarate-semialdehyde dehydrogenase